MANVSIPDAPRVAHFIATKLLLSANGAKRPTIDLTPDEFADAVSEVELETQVKGASFIKVHLIDPDWKIATSGLVDVSKEGLLPEIEVEFPERSGWLWVLCTVEGTNDFTSGSNLVLTFEDRIVAELRREWGIKRASPGFNVRAEFIKSLVKEVALHGQPAIRTRIPSAEGQRATLDKEITAIENALREVEATNATLTPEAEGVAAASQNKTAGVSSGASVTVKGAKASSTQVALINEVLGIASQGKAGPLATEGLLVACIAENDFTNNPGGGGGSTGLLQVIPSTAAAHHIDPLNVSQTVTAFLTEGFGGQGGAIAYARANPSAAPYEVAQAVQASGAGEASKGAANYGPWVDEAKAMIAAYSGGSGIPGGAEAEGIAAAGGGQSNLGEVSRGTTQNPDEDSWDCIQRLAGDVNWFAFTNGQTFFYMTGPELAGQKPSLFLEAPANRVTKETGRGRPVVKTGVIQVPLSYTFDNTSLEYLQDRKIHGKVQKRSRTAKPQTPSELRLNLVCELTEYRAGDVFVFRNSGPINGRWIVTDATRNCLKDTFTQFILEPPSAPLLETEEGKPETGEATVVPSSTLEAANAPKGVPAPAAGQYREPPTQGPNGVGIFQGVEVALWIIPELEYAQQSTTADGKPKKAWKGNITSGYRSGQDPHTATGASEHQKKQYPGGAVDFGGYEAFAERAAFFECVDGYTGLPLIPAQFPGDGGHASGSGH
jgi:hypothetical protein